MTSVEPPIATDVYEVKVYGTVPTKTVSVDIVPALETH
jgi:hypothetical protein